MIKTYCDICGKEMKTSLLTEKINNMNFAISSNGRCWDICQNCREEFGKWMKNKKGENTSED